MDQMGIDLAMLDQLEGDTLQASQSLVEVIARTRNLASYVRRFDSMISLFSALLSMCTALDVYSSQYVPLFIITSIVLLIALLSLI